MKLKKTGSSHYHGYKRSSVEALKLKLRTPTFEDDSYSSPVGHSLLAKTSELTMHGLFHYYCPIDETQKNIKLNDTN